MKFKILLRMLRYMAPSKGNIILVVVVSLLTSLLSVVSIYSILPLLNAVFSSAPLQRLKPQEHKRFRLPIKPRS